jgi:hypothetical protein
MGHIHADSMKLYAEDAAKHARPWELWEVCRPEQPCTETRWRILGRDPNWDSNSQYRRKPQTTRYRLALMNYSGTYLVAIVSDNYAPALRERQSTFVRWLTGWIQVEV